MTDDRFGFVLSSANAQAAEACALGMHGYCYWRVDAMSYLGKATELDDGFAMPRLAMGWILHLARSHAYQAKIEALLAHAGEHCVLDARERAHRDALWAASRGDAITAATILECWLQDKPTDLFAHRIAQFELFWCGRASWMRSLTEQAAPAWTADTPGFGMFLSCRAFANEELGNYGAAERFGRDAVAINPADPWGAHAVAHVLIMQGRAAVGVQWLKSLSDNWNDANQIKHHLWWHFALFLLEQEKTQQILELLRTKIRDPESPLVKAVPDATIDIQNLASMLMRLELRGVRVDELWHDLAEICAKRVHDHANAFSNAHDMMVLAATEQWDGAQALLLSMREFAASGSGSLRLSYRAAGIALCEAVLAHRRSDFKSVVEALAPVRHDLALIGGSHAQRDIFYQLLFDAAMNTKRSDLTEVLLRDVSRIGFELVKARTLYRGMPSA